MAGFIIFSPATAPIPDVPSPGQFMFSKTTIQSKSQYFQSLMGVWQLGPSLRVIPGLFPCEVA